MKRFRAWVLVLAGCAFPGCGGQEAATQPALARVVSHAEGYRDVIKDGLCQARGEDLLLDDMEDNDYLIADAEGRLASWFTFNPGCTQFPIGDKTNAFKMIPGGADDSRYMAATIGKGCQASWSGGGFGFQFLSHVEVKGGVFDSTPCASGYDASGLDGIAFDIAVWRDDTDADPPAADPQGVRRSVRVQVCTSDVKNFNCHGYNLTLPDDEWHTVRLTWKQLQQEDWAASTQKVAFNPSRLDKIQWKATVPTFHFAIDNLKFQKGSAHTPPLKSHIRGISYESLETDYHNWKARHLFTCPDGRAEVMINRNFGTGTSESTGYGLLLAVAMNDQATFGALLQGFHKRKNTHGLMAWSFPVCGDALDDANSAADADLDIAMALVLASQKGWKGADYAGLGKVLITAIKDFATTTCNSKLTVLKLGDAWGGCKEQTQYLNPSYFSPAFYREFGKFIPEQAAFWTKLAQDSYQLLGQYQSKMDGLVPDWGFSDGSLREPSKYGYEACRVPMRIATDFLWHTSADAGRVLTNLYSLVDSVGGPYETTLYAASAKDLNSCMLGGLALTAIAGNPAQVAPWVDQWLGTILHAPTDTLGDNPYFQGTMRLFYLLLATGYFAPLS